jgi:hypothetical protein
MILGLTETNTGDEGFLLVRVGSDSRPATQDDIEDIQAAMKDIKVLEGKDVLVTHHSIDVQWVAFNKEQPANPEELELELELELDLDLELEEDA